MKRIHLFSLALFTLFAVSCKKDKDNSLPAGLLKKEYYHRNADQVRIYQYKNRLLEQYEYSFDGTVTERHSFSYENGKRSRLEVATLRNGQLVPYKTEQYQHNNGNLTTVHVAFHNNPNYTTGIYTFVHDSRGFLNSCRIILPASVGQPMVSDVNALINFETDANGNIIKETREDYINGAFQPASVTTYTYDDDVNIKKGLETPTGYIEFFCKNNWLTKTHMDNTNTVIHFERKDLSFQSGRLVKAVHRSSLDGESTREYEYYE
jgi:hypothetical protein